MTAGRKIRVIPTDSDEEGVIEGVVEGVVSLESYAFSSLEKGCV